MKNITRYKEEAARLEKQIKHGFIDTPFASAKEQETAAHLLLSSLRHSIEFEQRKRKPRNNPEHWERCGFCGTDVPPPVFSPSVYHLPGCPRYKAPEKTRGRKSWPESKRAQWERQGLKKAGLLKNPRNSHRAKDFYEIAMAAGRDEADRQMKAEGRSKWNRKDFNLATRVTANLLEKESKAPRNNPPETKIYDRVCEIVAVKGPGHKCDAACKRARHTYRHKFSRKYKVGVYGSADSRKITLH